MGLMSSCFKERLCAHDSRLLGTFVKFPTMETVEILASAGLDFIAGLDRPEWRELHVDDTCVPVRPSGLRERLRLAGYVDVEVALQSRPEAEGPARRFRFAARRPVMLNRPATRSPCATTSSTGQSRSGMPCRKARMNSFSPSSVVGRSGPTEREQTPGARRAQVCH